MPKKYLDKGGRDDNKCSGIPTSRTHTLKHTTATHLQSLYVFICVGLCGFDNGERPLPGKRPGILCTTAYGNCPCYPWEAFKFSSLAGPSKLPSH